MNILILARSGWCDAGCFGNTLSNLFGGEVWSKDRFLFFYTRNELPDNEVCSEYYTVTIKDVAANMFLPNRIGRSFSYSKSATQNGDEKCGGSPESEQKLIDALHQHPFEIIYAVMESLYRSGIWANGKFREYINAFAPDIVFAPASDDGIMKTAISYIKQNTDAKIVLYAMDDVYGDYQKKSWLRRKKLIDSLTWMMHNADYIFGATEEICGAYEKIFDCQMEPLYKGCDLSIPVKTTVNKPLRIAYAGNLFYGRDEVLHKLAEALEDINQDGVKAELEIYTGATITKELEEKLNLGRSSKIMGRRPYEEIKTILHDADYVLQVESFEQEQIDYIHYSFSTKIIDCLQSGSAVLAIGPAGIASIEYLRKIEGVIVIDSIDNIWDVVSQAIEETDSIITNAEKIREFATAHHDMTTNRQNLREAFCSLLKE